MELDGVMSDEEKSNIVVVGEYLGAQMSAYKNELPMGLTEDIADGSINTEYPMRSIVISGVPFTCTNFGALPAGMNFDQSTGQLSGTPTETGIFTFWVRASATNQPALEHAYTFAITGTNELYPAHSTVDTVAYPLDSGKIIGLGLYTNGDSCTVSATALPGYRFSHWTDNDARVSTNSTYQFPVNLNRSLVANFVPAPPNVRISAMSLASHTIEWPTNGVSVLLEETTDLINWTAVNTATSITQSNATVTIPTLPGPRFYRLRAQ